MCVLLCGALLRGLLIGQRLRSVVLCSRHVLQLLALGVLATRVGLFAGADVVGVQLGDVRRILGAARNPGLGLGNAIAEQQAALGAPVGYPFASPLQQARVRAQPVEIGFERGDEASKAAAEARARRFRLGIEIDVVECGQFGRGLGVVERAADHGDDALAQACSLCHLPSADVGACRRRRQNEYDRVGVADEEAETRLPVLAAGYAVAVDGCVETVKFQCGFKLI